MNKTIENSQGKATVNLKSSTKTSGDVKSNTNINVTVNGEKVALNDSMSGPGTVQGVSTEQGPTQKTTSSTVVRLETSLSATGCGGNLTTPAGGQTTLTVRNQAKEALTYTIEGIGSKTIASGGRETFEFVSANTGRHKISCSNGKTATLEIS